MNFQIRLNPIGTVKSPIKRGTDDNWGEVISEIWLSDEYADGLKGIDHFSHVNVLFWMHQSSFDPATDLVRRPRGRSGMPEIGIFAQRAKHRPNPVGLTTVRLLARNGNRLTVQGLDAIDGTPVIDVKPYFPIFDRKSDATIPGWAGRLMERYF